MNNAKAISRLRLFTFHIGLLYFISMKTRPFTIPTILTADSDFAEMALTELRRARPQTEIQSELAPGVWLVKTPDGFTQLAEQWRHQPPIFPRHICPVHTTASLRNDTADIPILCQTIQKEMLDLLTPGLPFSVQTRIFCETSYKPIEVNTAVSQYLLSLTDAPLNVRAPVQILSIIITKNDKNTRPFAYLGMSLAAHNLSDWAGGAHRFARQPEQVSRSEFKLLEAIDVFQLNLHPYGTALDLGAAPGGWTRVLRQHKQYVTAVDPAELHPSLRADTFVRHKRITAEAYLAEIPDPYDMIVNDMRQDARDSARQMVKFAPFLYPHGFAIITLKLPEDKTAASGHQQILDHSFHILQQKYHIAGARHLFHNRSEITIHLKPLAKSLD